jgi:hypothetical protein
VEVRFNVDLVELKSACRRLIVRLADDSEGEMEFVIFSATRNTLEIKTGTFARLRTLPIGAHGERLAIQKAISGLRVLRRERLGNEA